MPGLQPIVGRALQGLGNALRGSMHEELADALRQRTQTLGKQRRLRHLRGSQIRFRQMHHGILRRGFQRVLKIRAQRRVIQPIIRLETRLDRGRRRQHQLARLGITAAREVRRAGQHNESVRIKILRVVQGLRIGVDAVQPAPEFIAKHPAQRIEQPVSMQAGLLARRLREYIQLPRASHRTIARGHQRLARGGIQRFVRQIQCLIEARPHPQGQDHRAKMRPQGAGMFRERKSGLCGSHLGTTHTRKGLQVSEQQR
ncbi:hypothetical protein D3C73_1045090 [compost metagenome]